MTRLARVALIVLAAAFAPAIMENEASADERSDIAVGTALQAVSNVILHKAEIAKGSRVNVTKILKRGEHVDGVSVALADGHVVKMTIAQLRSFFSVVRD